MKKMDIIPLIRNKDKQIYNVVIVTAGIIFILATIYTKFNPISMIIESRYLWNLIITDFLPPIIKEYRELLNAIIITIQIAFSATFLSALLALVLSFFGSNVTTPFPLVAQFIRIIASFIRNIPALVWAFILFMSLGIGTSVGFVALFISTFAFLIRAFIEVIDETSKDVKEALLASGANYWQMVVQGVIPSVITGFISWTLYCVEVNIRASTIIGMVGGGGIGLVLFSYIKVFKYNVACGIILVIACITIGVDWITNFIRKKVLL